MDECNNLKKCVKNNEVPTKVLQVHVQDALGLHARPAARLAHTSQQFVSDIQLAFAGVKVDAKSILDILSLCAPQGAALTLVCTGEDAHAASEVLERLFEVALFHGDE